jgi:preprotein translocase subunit YajC
MFVVFFFVGHAFADGGVQQSGGWMSFLPMVAFIAILYFLLIRPQQKRTKQHQLLIAALKRGDKVVTNSGIVATVSKIVNEQEIVLEIADGVHCRFIKSAVANVVPGDASFGQHEKSTAIAGQSVKQAGEQTDQRSGVVSAEQTESEDREGKVERVSEERGNTEVGAIKRPAHRRRPQTRKR